MASPPPPYQCHIPRPLIHEAAPPSGPGLGAPPPPQQGPRLAVCPCSWPLLTLDDPVEVTLGVPTTRVTPSHPPPPRTLTPTIYLLTLNNGTHKTSPNPRKSLEFQDNTCLKKFQVRIPQTHILRTSYKPSKNFTASCFPETTSSYAV